MLSSKHLPLLRSPRLRVSAPPVRLFLIWLSNEMEPTRNAAESQSCCTQQSKRLTKQKPFTSRDAKALWFHQSQTSGSDFESPVRWRL